MRRFAMVMFVFALFAPIAGLGVIGCGTGIDFPTVELPNVTVTTPHGNVTFDPPTLNPMASPQAPEAPEASPVPSPGPSPSPVSSPGIAPSEAQASPWATLQGSPVPPPPGPPATQGPSPGNVPPVATYPTPLPLRSPSPF